MLTFTVRNYFLPLIYVGKYIYVIFVNIGNIGYHMDMDNGVPVIFLVSVLVSAVPLSSLIS